MAIMSIMICVANSAHSNASRVATESTSCQLYSCAEPAARPVATCAAGNAHSNARRLATLVEEDLLVLRGRHSRMV